MLERTLKNAKMKREQLVVLPDSITEILAAAQQAEPPAGAVLADQSSPEAKQFSTVHKVVEGHRSQGDGDKGGGKA